MQLPHSPTPPHLVHVCAIAYAKGDGVRVKAVVVEWQFLSIGTLPVNAGIGQSVHGQTLLARTLLAHIEHVLVDVRDGNMTAALFRIGLFGQVLEVAETDVACAARHVQQTHAVLRSQTLDENVFPDTMNSHGHGIVH